RVVKAPASKRVTQPTPLVPRTSFSHVSGAVWPSGDIIPMPVTTTRPSPFLPALMPYALSLSGALAGRRSRRGPRRGAAKAPRPALPSRFASTPAHGFRGLLGVAAQIIERIPDRLHLVGVLVRDVEPEFLLEGHYQLDRID